MRNERILFAPLSVALALCAVLAFGGCSWRTLADQWTFSSPEATVVTFAKAATADDAARCFPASWPIEVRRSFYGRLGAWTEQRILSSKPTNFTGERMSVYDGASVVIVSQDREVLQEVVREDGRQRFWYLLRDCEGQWKIIALFKNSE